MDETYLSRLITPRSVLLVGSVEADLGLTERLARNLQAGRFRGRLTALDSRYRHFQGLPCVARISELPAAPDLAVVVALSHELPAVLGRLAEAGTGAAVVLARDLEGLSADRHDALRRDLQSLARRSGMRLLGPCNKGLQVPGVGLNASALQRYPHPGRLALVARSGALLSAALDRACDHGIGFSHVINLGEMWDVDGADVLFRLANDASTDAILLYLESVPDARRFLSAARLAAWHKALLVLKPFVDGTAADVDPRQRFWSDQVYDCALSRVGALRVHDVQEWFDMVETVGRLRRPGGDRLAIVSNGASLAHMAVDRLLRDGGRVTELGADSRNRLGQLEPALRAFTNPLDLGGDAGPQRYRQVVDALCADPEVDAVLAIHVPGMDDEGVAIAQALAEAAASAAKPLLACWLGGSRAQEARRLLSRRGVASYGSPARAVRAFAGVLRYHRNQELLAETPEPPGATLATDPMAAESLVEGARLRGVGLMSPAMTQALLASYSIGSGGVRWAEDSTTARKRRDGQDCHGLLHVGGVGDDGVPHLRSAFVSDCDDRVMVDRLEALLREAHPGIRVTAYGIEPVVAGGLGGLLRAGFRVDPLFGPVVFLGSHGAAGEAASQALGLPPLSPRLARDLIHGSGVMSRLPAEHGSRLMLEQLLQRLAELAVDQRGILSLEISPLVIQGDRIWARMAVAELDPNPGSTPVPCAIRPYPKELEERVELPDGRRWLLRPIRGEDEAAAVALYRRLSPAEIRYRFFSAPVEPDHRMVARLTQVDYERELALVLCDEMPGEGRIHGGVRLVLSPDGRGGEFSILLERACTGLGLGAFLMHRMIAHGQDRGLKWIQGDVLEGNRPMLALARQLGFRVAGQVESGVVRVVLDLPAEAA